MQVRWNTVDKHAATSKITLTAMKSFARSFVEHLYVQSLVQGNISEVQAVDACNKIVHILKCAPLLPSVLPQVGAYSSKVWFIFGVVKEVTCLILIDESAIVNYNVLIIICYIHSSECYKSHSVNTVVVWSLSI